MKRSLLLLIALPVLLATSQAQVINFGKTLPVRAYSLTLAPALNVSSVFHPELMGMSYMAMGGYGITYDLTLQAKYSYYNGDDYFGAQLEYLFRETRKSYYVLAGGLHKWEEYGIDAMIRYTYTPRYMFNLSFGLDMDVDISEVELRAWVPLNFGINFDDRFYVYLEYDLPVTEMSWDILAGGVTFIFR